MRALELVRSGVLKGSAALKAFNDDGGYVFHGSGVKVGLLEPKAAINYLGGVLEEFPEGERAVFATDKPEIAVFMALQNKDIDGWSSFSSNDRNEFKFRVSSKKWEHLNSGEAKGHVYVLNEDDFELVRGEFRSVNDVEPVSVVSVGREDLVSDVELSDDWPVI